MAEEMQAGSQAEQVDAQAKRGRTQLRTQAVQQPLSSTGVLRGPKGGSKEQFHCTTWCLGTRKAIEMFRVLSVLVCSGKSSNFMDSHSVLTGLSPVQPLYPSAPIHKHHAKLEIQA